MAIAKLIGDKPEWYGPIEMAWFPTQEACEREGVDRHGFCNLYDGICYHEGKIAGDEWELLYVDKEEECTVHWHSNAPIEVTGI